MTSNTRETSPPGRASGALLVLLILLLLPSPAPAAEASSKAVSSDAGAAVQDETPAEVSDRDTGRTFFFKEIVLSSVLSRRRDNMLGISDRPPGSYVAVDFVHTFTPDSRINRALPGWLQAEAVDLHPRLVYYGKMENADDMIMGDGVVWPMPEGKEFDLAPQDFWIRFRLAGRDRLTFRVGQIVLPYGVNPPLAPRQTFILPLEELDLGLKWDWGLGIKGPLGKLDWELAVTAGSGEVWHQDAGHLVTGRLGTPTYRDFQIGLSFLVGDLPTLHGPYVAEEFALSRWRLSVDSLYRWGTYLMLGGQVSYGVDGNADDENHVLVTGGLGTAEVFGARVWADWVPSVDNDLRIAGQLETLTRDLGTPNTTENAVVLEIGYSLTTQITIKMDYRAVLESYMEEQDNAFFFTFIYYSM